MAISQEDEYDGSDIILTELDYEDLIEKVVDKNNMFCFYAIVCYLYPNNEITLKYACISNELYDKVTEICNMLITFGYTRDYE